MTLPTGVFIIAIMIGVVSIIALGIVILDLLTYNNLQERLRREKEKDGKDDPGGD